MYSDTGALHGLYTGVCLEHGDPGDWSPWFPMMVTMVTEVAKGAIGGTDWAVCVVVVSIVANSGSAPDGKAIAMMLSAPFVLLPRFCLLLLDW